MRIVDFTERAIADAAIVQDFAALQFEITQMYELLKAFLSKQACAQKSEPPDQQQ